MPLTKKEYIPMCFLSPNFFG